MTEIAVPEEMDIATLLDGLAQVARESGAPVRIAAGTFAMYPNEAGGMVIVMKVDEGPLASDEPKHIAVPGSLIRALTAMAGGAGRMGAVKAALGGRKRGNRAE